MRTGLRSGTSATPEERAELQRDRELLRRRYADYDPRRHDAFVYRYRQEQEYAALEAWKRARHIE